MSKDEQKLHLILQEIYEKRRAEIRVSPLWLATEAMVSLDEFRRSPSLVYQAAHLQLRQMARAICRERFEDDKADSEQHELFPNLQKRYPAAHSPDAEPEYVLLEHLTDEDVAYNVNRLRAEAKKKEAHANALEAWWQRRVDIAVAG